MKKFNLIFQEYMYNLEKGDIENNILKKQYRSLEQFQQFCKKLLLFVELVKYSIQDKERKFIGANLYFINNNDKDMNNQFEYYLKNNKRYFSENEELFNALTNYKNKYIVTLDGKKESPIILWG